MQQNTGLEAKPRRKRRSRDQIAELVTGVSVQRKSSGLSQRAFSEQRGITLDELQPSLKIVRRSQPASVDGRANGSRGES